LAILRTLVGFLGAYVHSLFLGRALDVGIGTCEVRLG